MKNILKNKKWRKRGKWHHSITFSEIFGEGESTTSSKKLEYTFKRTLGIWLPNGDYYDLEKEWLAINKIVNKEYSKNPQYLTNYANDCLKRGEKVIKVAEETRDKQVKNLTNEELIKLYSELIKKCRDYMPFMFSLHLFDKFLTKKFETLLKQFLNNKSEKYFEYQTALVTPFKKIFVLQEKEDLIKIATKNNNKILKDHVKKYSWINCILLENEPYKQDYFKKRLKKLDVEVKEMLKSEKDLKKKQKKYMKEIRKHKELFQITKTVQIFAFLRSFRVDVPHIALGYCWNLIEEITKRLNIKPLDIKYLSSTEVKEAFNNNNYKKLISERKKGILSVMINNQRHEITDEKDINKIIELMNLPKEEKSDSVKGNIAYPGKITGTAKVLHSVKDIKTVKTGDILIISMTDPNYIPAMEKAAAFVTDMGGILCHAAIISREMQKPCIIGTKIATKVFKTGDKVEVDADKGIVNFISH